MDQLIADLIGLLELETLEVNLFRGTSAISAAPEVFGGQVLGQALNAASRTVSGRMVHSLHAYFLVAEISMRPSFIRWTAAATVTVSPTDGSSPSSTASRSST